MFYPKSTQPTVNLHFRGMKIGQSCLFLLSFSAVNVTFNKYIYSKKRWYDLMFLLCLFHVLFCFALDIYPTALSLVWGKFLQVVPNNHWDWFCWIQVTGRETKKSQNTSARLQHIVLFKPVSVMMDDLLSTFKSQQTQRTSLMPFHPHVFLKKLYVRQMQRYGTCYFFPPAHIQSTAVSAARTHWQQRIKIHDHYVILVAIQQSLTTICSLPDVATVSVIPQKSDRRWF